MIILKKKRKKVKCNKELIIKWLKLNKMKIIKKKLKNVIINNLIDYKIIMNKHKLKKIPQNKK